MHYQLQTLARLSRHAAQHHCFVGYFKLTAALTTLPSVTVSMTEAVELPAVSASLASTVQPVADAATDITPVAPAPQARLLSLTAFTPSTLSKCQFLILQTTCELVSYAR